MLSPGRVLQLLQHKPIYLLQFFRISSSTMSMLTGPSSDGPRPPNLEFAGTTLDQRKDDARDVVSSFNPTVLPSEFRPDVYRRITEEQSQRPSSEWTIVADL